MQAACTAVYKYSSHKTFNERMEPVGITDRFYKVTDKVHLVVSISHRDSEIIIANGGV